MSIVVRPGYLNSSRLIDIALGEIALGVREGEDVVLNPAGEQRSWVRAETKVVTMVTYE